MSFGETCSILIADDDRNLCSSLSDVIELRGHRVETVFSGNSALEACARSSHDLLLLDVSLPDISGLDLISQIEEIRPELEILIITGHASLDSAVHAVSRSTIGYLTKPLDLDRLLDIVDGIVKRKRLARENQRLLEGLQRARRQWESTFNAISHPIALMSAEGLILRVNRAFSERFGRPFKECAGEPASELIFRSAGESSFAPPAEGHALEERDDLAIEGTFELSSHAVDLEGGRGTIIVVRDISERKSAAAVREALIGQLERQNAELEGYAYTVSHDLKSPLVTITGFLELVESNALAGNLDQVRADSARIRTAALRMKDLLEQLLELSRLGRVVNPPEEVSLVELTRVAVEMVSPPGGEVEIEFGIADDLPTIHGDRVRLLEVFQNLVDNAVKFMGDQPAPRVEIFSREVGGETVIHVSDNGIGIDPDYRDKVFGLFDKIDASSGGTGIGLALVKRIVELHGGHIWVESTGPGRGSTFCFTLPGD